MDDKMKKAVAQAKREYFRRWRNEHPDKVKANLERYWRKKAEQLIKEEEANGATENTTQNDDHKADS